MRILLVIRSLDFGGAERQWINLAKGLFSRRDIELMLCTFYSGGKMDSEISSMPHVCIDKNGKSDILFLLRYRKVIKDFRPDVIYAFMPDANIFSLIASLFLKVPVVFGFRSSSIDVNKLPFFSRLYFYVQKYCSRYASAIICNSNEAIVFYGNHGYFMDKSFVVYNGIDTCRFNKDLRLSMQLRSELGIDRNNFVFGISARMNKVKDYPLFAKGARYILERYDNVHFVSVGKIDNDILNECIEILGEFRNKVLFLGAKQDIERYYSIFDCIVSTSYTESFSNSIAEGMCCGAIPLVSDVGESVAIARFTNDYNVSFTPKDLQEFSSGLEEVLHIRDISHLKENARNHIVENFSISRMVDNTIEVLRKCI